MSSRTNDWRGYITLHRSSVGDELLGDKNALHLLTAIAYRAHYSGEPTLEGRTYGQALIGDHDEIDMSRGEYRAAMRRLEKWGLVAFRGTAKGTIATLLDDRVFQISADRKASVRPVRDHQHDQRSSFGALQEATTTTASAEPANDQRATTKKKERKEEKVCDTHQITSSSTPSLPSKEEGGGAAEEGVHIDAATLPDGNMHSEKAEKAQMERWFELLRRLTLQREWDRFRSYAFRGDENDERRFRERVLREFDENGPGANATTLRRVLSDPSLRAYAREYRPIRPR